MVEARTDRGTRMPAAPSTSFMTCLSRNGTVWATSRPGVPIRSRRRAARYIVASHIDSTRSTLVPRSAASVSSTAAPSSANEEIWTYRLRLRRAISGSASAGWSPTPMTLAPSAASAWVKIGISLG